MKKSVGLVVAVRIPDGDGHQVYVILQRRGTFNHEKMAPENYPGCLQVTCHGKLIDGEDFADGLLREMIEELGPTFMQVYCHGYHGKLLTETRSPEAEVLTFGTLMPIDMIRDYVRLGPDTGGLVYIKADQVDDIVEITEGMKVHGPELTHTMAMFPDEIAAVRKAFEIFGKM